MVDLRSAESSHSPRTTHHPTPMEGGSALSLSTQALAPGSHELGITQGNKQDSWAPRVGEPLPPSEKWGRSIALMKLCLVSGRC